jgi:hypothetical protein
MFMKSLISVKIGDSGMLNIVLFATVLEVQQWSPWVVPRYVIAPTGT